MQIVQQHKVREGFLLHRRFFAQQNGFQGEDVVGVFQFAERDQQHGVSQAEEHVSVALVLQARKQRSGEVQVAQFVQGRAVFAQHRISIGV